MALNALFNDEPATDETYLVDNDSPQVTSVVVDDGTAQRSVVRSITVNFDSAITFDAGAFDLKTAAGDSVVVTTSVAPGTPTNQVVLTFPGTLGGSLADGRYQLKILGTHIRDAAGNSLDGDANGTAGGNRVDDFFRLFGDRDGSGRVDRRDYGFFLRSFNRSTGDPLFDDTLDADGNGSIDRRDFGFFQRNFGKSI